jgi:predicted outer membrane repeat protein
MLRAGRSAIVLTMLLAPRGTLADETFDFNATLRIDLHHAGDRRGERYMLDELRLEGAWPGSRTQLIAAADFGCTSAEVYAPARDGQLLFRTNFCTLFGEWQTTDEAKTRQRTFSETVRLPAPRASVRLVIKSRDRRGRMVKVFETLVDPAAQSVSRERRQRHVKLLKLHYSGEPRRCLDVVILGDGYERWQLEKYRRDARRFTSVLLTTPPFAALRDKINVWGIESPSRESGVDEPSKGIFRDTAFSMSFNTFGSSRYLMTTDNKALRDVAANAPYDAIYIMSNTSRYGGGGIYGLYASFVSDNEYDEYVFIHEFGHSFGGLGDEYYTSQVSYNDMYPRGVEPWEPNLTVQTQRAKIKWRDQIADDTPIPTWPGSTNAARVGLFEGAGYSAKGLYRPALDCKMFDKGHKAFCPVCMKAVSEAILRYTR